MNLEKANGTPSTNVKRPYMMHTLDMSCPALTKMGRNDETIKKDEVIQQEAHFQVRYEAPDF